MNQQILAQLKNPVLPPSLGGSGAPTDYEQAGATIGKLIGGIVGGFFVFAFVFAFMYLLIGGLRWVTSGGDKAGLESARNQITHAILGLIIVGAAWAIMTLVGQFFGFEFTKDVFILPLPSLK